MMVSVGLPEAAARELMVGMSRTGMMGLVLRLRVACHGLRRHWIQDQLDQQHCKDAATTSAMVLNKSMLVNRRKLIGNLYAGYSR